MDDKLAAIVSMMDNTPKRPATPLSFEVWCRNVPDDTTLGDAKEIYREYYDEYQANQRDYYLCNRATKLAIADYLYCKGSLSLIAACFGKSVKSIVSMLVQHARGQIEVQ